MINRAKQILKNVFGYDDFRPLQEEIIENVMGKNDTLVIMPTGGGKSLCYQIPALIFPGLTIVVSPLISLMKDQVEQLVQMGVSVTYLNSSLTLDQYRRNVRRVKQGEVKLLYMAPEALLKPNMLTMLSSVEVDCITIDEAHCISEWGHDFRPEYRQLLEVRNRFPNATCIALTATATPRVREDIKRNLGFANANEFIASFNRENLFIQIAPKYSPLHQTIEFLHNHRDQSGIVYCYSRRQVDDLYEALKGKGFSVKPYHAGLSEGERTRNQDLFIKDDVQIIIATIAFGMGIDKPNVRFVVHYDPPQNIETYYQEIGRAGRDGLRSDCLMLFGYGDIQKIYHFINKKEGHEQRAANIHLNALLRFIETEVCRRVPLLNYFGETYSESKCRMCDNCLIEEKDLEDITLLAQKFLSCAKRTKEMFGAGHIIDVLRGSKAKKVLQFGHHHLSTYGIGQDYSKKQWFHLSRQFIQKGLLFQDMEFGSLKLRDKAWGVLKGEEKVFGKVEADRVHAAPESDMDLDYDRDLFEILRKERKRLAESAGIPPYIIFSDRTLVEMATFFPQRMESLLRIHGVGEVKAEKYGLIFLNIIEEYCRTHEIDEGSMIIKKPVTGSLGLSRKKKHEIIGAIYNSGQTLGQIFKQIICLANSRKYSGRCVAGKELLGSSIGGWIRPVSDIQTGELSIKATSYKNGKTPELLDIVSVPLVKHCPHSYQTENYLVGEHPWVKKGQLPISDLEKLQDNVDCLWVNGYNSHNGLNDRMPQELVEERLKSSLLFIKPEKISFTVEEGANLLAKVRSKFTFAGTEYWLPITDPVTENRFFHQEMGEYLIDRRDLYLTISIGEPYNGFCYKLVAGIFNLLW